MFLIQNNFKSLQAQFDESMNRSPIMKAARVVMVAATVTLAIGLAMMLLSWISHYSAGTALARNPLFAAIGQGMAKYSIDIMVGASMLSWVGFAIDRSMYRPQQHRYQQLLVGDEDL